jgi:hypothetical protein
LNPAAIALLVLIAGLVSRTLAYMVWKPVRFPTEPGLMLGLIVGVLVAPVVVLLTRRSGDSSLMLWTWGAVMLCGFAILGIPGFTFVNGALDNRPPRVVRADIVNRGHRLARLRILTEGDLLGTVVVYPVHRVPLSPTKMVELTIREGRLGYPWIAGIRESE